VLFAADYQPCSAEFRDVGGPYDYLFGIIEYFIFFHYFTFIRIFTLPVKIIISVEIITLDFHCPKFKQMGKVYL